MFRSVPAITFLMCWLSCQAQISLGATRPRVLLERFKGDNLAIDRLVCMSESESSEKRNLEDVMTSFLNETKNYHLRRITINVCDKLGPSRFAQAIGLGSSEIGLVWDSDVDFEVVLRNGVQDPRRLVVGGVEYELYSFELFGPNNSEFEIRTKERPSLSAAELVSAELSRQMAPLKSSACIFWGYKLPSGPSGLNWSLPFASPYFRCYNGRCRLNLDW